MTKKLKCINVVIIGVVLMLICSLFCLPTIHAEGNKEVYYNSILGPSARAVNDYTLNYTRKEVLIDNELPIKTPNYYDRSVALKNGCAAVAGSIVIGYYDKDFENLIAGYSPTIKRGEHIVFKPADSNIQLVMNDLFSRMHVNEVQPGATEDDFKNGLRSYITSKGYNVSYISYGSGKNLNYDGIIQSFNMGHPIVVFATMNHIIKNLDIGDTQLTMSVQDYNANHILVANGIKQVKYYNGTNVIRTDTYLSVSTGLSAPDSGYIRLEDITAINDLVGVLIQ